MDVKESVFWLGERAQVSSAMQFVVRMTLRLAIELTLPIHQAMALLPNKTTFESDLRLLNHSELINFTDYIQH